MSKFMLIAVSILSAATLHGALPNWEKLEGCTLGDTKYADGDSFHVNYDGKDLIITLAVNATPTHPPTQKAAGRSNRRSEDGQAGVSSHIHSNRPPIFQW